MQNAIVLLAYAAVVILSFIPVIKKMRPREIFAYSLILFLSISGYVLKVFINPDLKTISVVITEFINKLVGMK